MGLLSDVEIFDLCQGSAPMITGVKDITQIEYLFNPLDPNNTFDAVKLMGFGIDSYGYDAKLAPDVEIFVDTGEIFDPKRPTKEGKVKGEIIHEGKESYVVLESGGFMLGYCPEYIRMPKDCIGIVLGKSSYARNGIIVNPTVLKPGWDGQVVLEIHNAKPGPVKVYVNEGIAHFIFIRGDRICSLDYLARGGKYQGQKGITHGRA